MCVICLFARVDRRFILIIFPLLFIDLMANQKMDVFVHHVNSNSDDHIAVIFQLIATDGVSRH